jgi:cobaltochelatase CobN
MHLLASSSATLDDLAEPIDLGQAPAAMLALSFTDSDLSALASSWDAATMPSLRLASLRDLRHPLSVDVWIEKTASRAKVILVRLLGGYEWWRYGCDQLAATARERGIKLALLPGESHEADERLAALSTLPAEELDVLLAFFREGGPENMRSLLRRLANGVNGACAGETAEPLPKTGFYDPERGIVSLETMLAIGDAPLSVALRATPLPHFHGGEEMPVARVAPFLAPAERGRGVPAEPGRRGGKTSGDDRAIIPILFYRSMLLSADVAPIDALAAALEARGMKPVPVFVPSLKDAEAVRFVEEAVRRLRPPLLLAATAFASGGGGGEKLFDRVGVPVMQVIVATTRREAWEKGQRGLAPADLAMHVVLPELDGRILAGAISFKAESEADAVLGFRGQFNRPEPDRVEAVAERVAAFLRLQTTPRDQRRVAILVPDYPGAAGRTGYAVGLDVPASVLAMLHDLKTEGYRVEGIPESPRELLRLLEKGVEGLSRDAYSEAFAGLPAAARANVEAAWGPASEVLPPVPRSTLPPSGLPAISPTGGEITPAASACASSPASEIGAAAEDSSISPLVGEMAGRPEGGDVERKALTTAAFHFRAARFGNITVALAPDRGREEDRRADYHDPKLPPRHDLVAFGFWLRDALGCHALVHVGAHGTLEWLPGKTVALSRNCFPEIVTGGLPVVYPFIVSNPGEAAQAKRRIGAVTIGHLPPPLAAAGLSGEQRELEHLVDEYAQADGLDRRRRDRLAKLIVETAERNGLAGEAGVSVGDDPDAALLRIDSWLCDLKDFAVKDGLHIYGRGRLDESEPLRRQSAEAERAALLAALDGRHVAPGPAGAPARGRTDVLPTGRNLFAVDPRTMPTPTAFALGRAASEEVLRRYAQDHGEWPRSLVIDLWGSASLRTGGEEIAQGLALMGCRPEWDPATGRVTGIEVLPPAMLGRPRVDVTWRISGLFRDMFPTQIALMDAAVRAVARRDGEGDDNPLALAAEGCSPQRIFGSSPGTYGTGVEAMLASGRWREKEEIGRAYLDGVSHAYGGAEGESDEAAGAFAERVRDADILVHSGDDPGRDQLEGAADVAYIGGFSAALSALGGKADLVILDTTDPDRPRARSLAEAVTRIVRARAANPRFIAGQMRHGPRGAAELLETVDRLIGFAETTDAVSGALIDAVHDAYLGDPEVRAFLLRENPTAARAMAERFLSARQRGLWHTRRNSLDNDLAEMIAEARAEEAA